MTIIPSLPTNPSAAANPTPLVPLSTSSGSGSGGLSFSDLVNAVNPLQHIPVVSSLYRAATGSSISATSQIAGDTLYGALTGGVSLLGAGLGLASSATNVAVQQAIGSDLGQHVMSALGVGNTTSASATVAAAQPPAQAALATTQLGNALGNAQHTGSTSDYSGAQAQYQRTQAFDVINKRLVKMVA